MGAEAALLAFYDQPVPFTKQLAEDPAVVLIKGLLTDGTGLWWLPAVVRQARLPKPEVAAPVRSEFPGESQAFAVRRARRVEQLCPSPALVGSRSKLKRIDRPIGPKPIRNIVRERLTESQTLGWHLQVA